MRLKKESQTMSTEPSVLRTFKLPDSLNETLKKAAHANCMNVSEYLRFLIVKAEKESAGD